MCHFDTPCWETFITHLIQSIYSNIYCAHFPLVRKYRMKRIYASVHFVFEALSEVWKSIYSISAGKSYSRLIVNVNIQAHLWTSKPSRLFRFYLNCYPIELGLLASAFRKKYLIKKIATFSWRNIFTCKSSAVNMITRNVSYSISFKPTYLLLQNLRSCPPLPLWLSS